MPNWTINKLDFPNEELAKKAYDEACIDSKFMFEANMPFPTSSDGLDPKYIFNEESHCDLMIDTHVTIGIIGFVITGKVSVIAVLTTMMKEHYNITARSHS